MMFQEILGFCDLLFSIIFFTNIRLIELHHNEDFLMKIGKPFIRYFLKYLSHPIHRPCMSHLQLFVVHGSMCVVR